MNNNASLDYWNALHDAILTNDPEEVEATILQMRELDATDEQISNIINRDDAFLYHLTDNNDIRELLRDAGAVITQEGGSKKRAIKRGGRATKRRATKRRATKRRATKRRAIRH